MKLGSFNFSFLHSSLLQLTAKTSTELVCICQSYHKTWPYLETKCRMVSPKTDVKSTLIYLQSSINVCNILQSK